MKAKDLNKNPLTIEDIEKEIVEKNKHGHYKHFIPYHVFVEEETILHFVQNGFKVYKGDWDGIMTNVTIIEW